MKGRERGKGMLIYCFEILNKNKEQEKKRKGFDFSIQTRKRE